MFLCDDCHDVNAHPTGLWFRSRGTCESCGKTANCIDCHYRQCNPPRRGASAKPAPKKERTR